MSAIQATDLVRRFGEVEAVRGVSLEVAEGEIYGFLGPNGAGKSTIVRILTTLLQPTSGSGHVLGHDVTREPTTVRRLIGVALQEAGLDPKQTGRELLTLQGKLYGLKGKVLGDQVVEVTGSASCASGSGPPSSSPPSTWRRPTSWPTGWRSSTTAGSCARAPRRPSRPRSAPT
jgi:ABC-2 type transport system ATP-binding protein